MSQLPVAFVACAAVVLAACSSSSAEPPPHVDSPVGAPSEPSPAIDLGTSPAGTALAFDVPADALGFTILADAAAGAGDAIGVVELVDPDGNVVVADFASTPHRTVGSGVGTFVYPPIADAAPATVRAGHWKVKLGGDSADGSGGKGGKGATLRPWSGDVHGVVLVQTGAAGAFAGGALDLDLYVPPGLVVGKGPLDATSAPADETLRARIDHVFVLVSRLYGLERGEVRFHPIDASVRTIAGPEAIDAANRLATARGARPSAQVILTNALEPDGAGAGEISGIANCLPGAVGVPGTPCSAVIVALRSSVEEDATTIVHELGHFVGLEHTTELDGTIADELSDTPVCRSVAKSELASCPDFSNLMFPTSIQHEARDVVVSPTQARVMHASPIYRAKGR